MSISTLYKQCKTCEKSALCWSYGGPYGFRERFFTCRRCWGLSFLRGAEYEETRAPTCPPLREVEREAHRREYGVMKHVSPDKCPYCRADKEAKKNGTL